MDRKSASTSSKGMGFKQPDNPHKHWHTDVSYINVGGTFLKKLVRDVVKNRKTNHLLLRADLRDYIDLVGFPSMFPQCEKPFWQDARTFRQEASTMYCAATKKFNSR